MQAPRDSVGRWSPWGAVALLVMTVLAYAGVVDAGFVVDDREYIETNRTLEDVDGLRRIWTEVEAMPHFQYYPAVVTTFWVEHQLWGKDPLGYHLVNVALHALNVWLLWRLLLVLAVPGAWLAAAIFALHPVQVETVAWVTERKNLVYVAFYLAAALAYLRFAGIGAQAKRPALWYGAALALFALAMVSKASAFSLPAALALLLWMKGVGRPARHALALAPLFALAIGLGAFSAYAERQYVGALGEQWDQSFLERFLIAGRALWFYAGKLCWPHPISFNYERWVIDTSQAWQYLFPIAAVALPCALWALRRRVGRGPLVAVLLFGGSLAPFLGFVNFFFMRYSYVADHLVYLSSAAWIALVVAVGVRLTGSLGRPARGALAALVLLPLGVATARHVPVYESDETLWRDTIQENPEAWVAHMLLGYELYLRGAYDESVQSYDRALALTDGHPAARITCMRGMTLLADGQVEAAIPQFKAALEVKPTHFDSHYHLAQALEQQGKPQQAARHYTHALRSDPGHAPAMVRLAALLLEFGQRKDAHRLLEEALRIDPADPIARALLRR